MKLVARAQAKPIPGSIETSTTSVPGRSAASSRSEMSISGWSVSCRTQLTITSCSASSSASGRLPPAVSARARPAVAPSRSKPTRRIAANGAATAAMSRWVRTVTSETPAAPSALTAPRAVAPKEITAARSGRP